MKSFKSIREGWDKTTQSADKKPEKYTKPDGKTGIRMVPAKRDVEEKKLTPAEIKKREEIAKAMERDNPGMDMKKKMAIATWQAKKVAESKDNEYHKTLAPTKNSDEGIAALKKKHGMTHDQAKATIKRLMGEDTQLDEASDTQMGTITVKTDAERKARAQAYRDKKAKATIKSEGTELDEDRRAELYHQSMMFTHAMKQAQTKKEDPRLSKQHDMAGKLHAKAADMHADNHPDAAKHTAKADKLSKLLGETTEVDELSMSLKALTKTGINKKGHGDKEQLKKDLEKMKQKLNKEQVEVFEGLLEARDEEMDRIKQLVRLGLMDKKDMTKIVRALTIMKSGKAIPQREREVLFDMLNELIGIITGDQSIFTKARKAVQEEVQVDEVLDTPKGMDSYRAKAKYALDRAKNSAVASTLRKDKPEFDKAVKTMSKREKGLKMADKNAMKKTFKMLRKESDTTMGTITVKTDAERKARAQAYRDKKEKVKH